MPTGDFNIVRNFLMGIIPDGKPFASRGGQFAVEDAITVTESGSKTDRGELTFRVNGTSAHFEAGEDSGSEIVDWTMDIEQEWLDDLLSELQSDDVVYDVGANLGVYSCFVMNKLDSGKVIAFEPYPPNVEQLRRNLDRNEGNYRVIEKALSNESTTEGFTSSASSEVGHATGTIAPGQGCGSEIETIRGDELVSRDDIPEPDVVKIDVEGSEPLVLEGLKQTLSELTCRLVYCEIHLPKEDGSRPSVKDYDSSTEDLKSQLQKLGYDLEKTVRRNQELHVKARR
ncbi:MAG: FkbM family methyltransferase [bacterium]